MLIAVKNGLGSPALVFLAASISSVSARAQPIRRRRITEPDDCGDANSTVVGPCDLLNGNQALCPKNGELEN
jgi:hypothetical protein